MDTIEINNPFEKKISSKLIKGVAAGAVDFLKKKKIVGSGCDFELSIALVNTGQVVRLNRRYRGKDEPTDVLSFCYERSGEKISGEVILCPQEIEKNARNDKIETEIEFAKNTVHGILHVAGLDHGRKMFSLQEEILSAK